MKKTVTRKRPDERRTRALKTVRALTRRARAELVKLLKRNQARTITQVELETGLRELDERLKQIAFHEFKL